MAFFRKLPTVFIFVLLLVIGSLAGLLAYARVEHWSLNSTTCMPLGFYQRGPIPRELKDGDRVYFCPEIGNPLHLSFVGFPAFQKSVKAGENPAMAQAIDGMWLERTPQGHWHCPRDLVPFAKEVVATAGQTVQITKSGVVANGHLLPNSQIVTKVDGMPVVHLPIGFRMVIPKGYFWDYAPGTFAYTSAYYGPEPVKNILGGLRPALVIPGSQYWYPDHIQNSGEH
jgi:hypothetical protein